MQGYDAKTLACIYGLHKDCPGCSCACHLVDDARDMARERAEEAK
jgi:hypothetical protein